MKQKQNAVDLTDLAIGILVLGIVVAVGTNILISVRDSTLTGLDVDTTTNETTWVNTTTDNLANTWGISVSECYGDGNQSTNGPVAKPDGYVLLPAANYSTAVGSANGVITIQNATAIEYPNATCTYTSYDTTRPDWALPNDAATGIAEYGNWFDIIVIVGIAGLILSLIFLAFGNRGGGDSGQLY